MKPKTSEQIAAAARDGAGIDAAVKRAVAKELDMRRRLGLPIVTAESIKSRADGETGHANRTGQSKG